MFYLVFLLFKIKNLINWNLYSNDDLLVKILHEKLTLKKTLPTISKLREIQKGREQKDSALRSNTTNSVRNSQSSHESVFDKAYVGIDGKLYYRDNLSDEAIPIQELDKPLIEEHESFVILWDNIQQEDLNDYFTNETGKDSKSWLCSKYDLTFNNKQNYNNTQCYGFGHPTIEINKTPAKPMTKVNPQRVGPKGTERFDYADCSFKYVKDSMQKAKKTYYSNSNLNIA